MLKKIKPLSLFLCFTMVFLLIGGTVCTFASEDAEVSTESLQTEAEEESSEAETELSEEEQKIKDLLSLSDNELMDKDVFNILIIGADSREDNFSGRSDTILLVTINKDAKRIVLSSFLRDSYVEIPGDYENNRLNEAYAYGGSELLVEAIKLNYDIDVDRCITLNFFLFMDIIDLAGGIDLDVEATAIPTINNYIHDTNMLLGVDLDSDLLDENSSGYMHLNGIQTLSYARNRRYPDGDFTRTTHQREVAVAFYEKLKELTLTELLEMAHTILSRIDTDLQKGEGMYLLSFMLKLDDYDIKSISIPTSGTWRFEEVRGLDVVTLDFNANTEYWNEQVYGEEEETEIESEEATE